MDEGLNSFQGLDDLFRRERQVEDSGSDGIGYGVGKGGGDGDTGGFPDALGAKGPDAVP